MTEINIDHIYINQYSLSSEKNLSLGVWQPAETSLWLVNPTIAFVLTPNQVTGNERANSQHLIAKAFLDFRVKNMHGEMLKKYIENKGETWNIFAAEDWMPEKDCTPLHFPSSPLSPQPTVM